MAGSWRSTATRSLKSTRAEGLSLCTSTTGRPVSPKAQPSDYCRPSPPTATSWLSIVQRPDGGRHERKERRLRPTCERCFCKHDDFHNGDVNDIHDDDHGSIHDDDHDSIHNPVHDYPDHQRLDDYDDHEKCINDHDHSL